jgi:hypothetical protein
LAIRFKWRCGSGRRRGADTAYFLLDDKNKTQNRKGGRMLKIQGSIKGVKVAVSQTGMSRQVTFDIAGDSVLDELQEIMKQRSRLNITIEKQQLNLGQIPEVAGNGSKKRHE